MMVSTVQVIRPLLPKHKPASIEAPDGPSALRRFPEAEKLLQDDPRFAKAPERDRYVQRRFYFCCLCWFLLLFVALAPSLAPA